MGGKFAIRKTISHIINQTRPTGMAYIEPFVGACNIISNVDDTGPLYGYDAHKELIAMWQSMQRGWIPPKLMTEDEYYRIKTEGEPHEQGFAGFGCSFGGKWWGGIARSCHAKRDGRLRVKSAHDSNMGILLKIQNVIFECKDYRELKPSNSFLYLDPPYASTSSFKGLLNKFDSSEFWRIAEKWSKDNIVCVSEYQAPAHWTEIWATYRRMKMRMKGGVQPIKVERLFTLQSELFKTRLF